MATFDQLGDAAGSISNRLRRTASIVPEGTPAKVKKTQARFSRDLQPSEESVLLNADSARPEVFYQEGRDRIPKGTPAGQAIYADSYLGSKRPISRQEQTVNELIVNGVNSPDPVTQARALARRAAGQRSSQMSGQAAQAMSDSRPYVQRMLRADQPDLGLGSGAQAAISQNTGGGLPIGSPGKTLSEIYSASLSRPVDQIDDLPNEYLGLGEDELKRRLSISGGENVVDTRSIPERIEQGTYGRDYGSQENFYKDISSGTIEDRALATGNPMDEYLSSITSPGLSYDERTLDYGQRLADFNLRNPNRPIEQQATRLVLPENAYVPNWDKTRLIDPVDYNPDADLFEIPNVIIPRSAERTVIDSLGGNELSRRLRQSTQMQPIYNSPTERVALTRGSNRGALSLDNGQIVVAPGLETGGAFTQQPLRYSRGVEQLRNAPVANPVQVDFRQSADQGRRLADAQGRVRGAQLDQQIMAENAAATGADTTNFVVKDVNPDEYYLYGSQADTQGLLPDEMLGVSRTYGYEPSASLVTWQPGKTAEGKAKVGKRIISLKPGYVGLGVDITNADPYRRAAVVRTVPGYEGLVDKKTGKFAQGQLDNPLTIRQIEPGEDVATSPWNSPRLPDIQTELITIRDNRLVPVDPITPVDMEIPGLNYAEKIGLQADVTPEQAIYQDKMAAARLRAIANIEQNAVNKYQAAPRKERNPTIKRRADVAYNSMIQSDILDRSAADMENAMRIANEQTVPQGNVILTQISNQGPGQSIPIRAQEMPFEQALEIMKPYERGGAAEQVLRLPVVPTVAPEQTQLSKRLRLAQQVGTPESASIMSDPAMGLYKQIAQVDPNVQVNEIRRGVQYTMVPEGEVGQGYKIRLDNPGEPVIDPATGQRMRWQGQPIETYNPRQQAQAQANQVRQQANYEVPQDVADPLAQQQAPIEFATRARATRPQIKQETYQQTADAIDEGYVLKGTGDPYDQVLVSGNDLSEMRGGLSRLEMRQAQQHNLAREMSGLPPLNPVEMTGILKKNNLNMEDRTVNLIQNPPAQGGVFTWGDDDYGYGAAMAAKFPSSGPPIEIQSGGMLNAYMVEPLEPRFMRPRIRQVNPAEIQAQGPLVYQAPPQVPNQVQPVRIEGRPDLDWQRSPSFRFPQNVWQGSSRVI